MRNPAVCVCKNKGADQLRSNRAADQHFVFRDIDSAFPLLPKSKISSIQPSSVVVQHDLCRACSVTQKAGFPAM